MNDEALNWEALYQQGDTGWDRGGASPALMQWLDDDVLGGVGSMGAVDSTVLIPGCGYGHEVLELAARGFAVTGLDIAPSAVKALNQSLSEVSPLSSSRSLCTDLFDYEPSHPVDIIYEQTCLCTLNMQQRIDYEQCLHGWLKHDGVLLLLLMQTGEPGGPPFHCDLMQMRQLFDGSRWLWSVDPPLFIPRPKGGRFELGFVLQRK